jgi:hypothetical protein
MTVNDIKAIAKLYNIPIGKAKKCDLIRAIQRAEGNQQCYATNTSGCCGQDNCLWREDCV